VCTVTFTGNCQVCWVSAATPTKADCVIGGSPQKSTTDGFGAFYSVIAFCTTGPLTNAPTSLMEDCSTLMVTVVPGA